MKNIVLTASLTVNLFLGALAYAFLSGSMSYQAPEASYTQAEQDYVTKLASK